MQQLPASDIFSLYRKDSILYAGGKNIIYRSIDKGQTWDSTSIIPLFTSVGNIIVYKNELFASSFSAGVVKSADGGNTWQKINTGLFPQVSDFFEWRGDLYAATLGAFIFKLDPITRNSWAPFNNGLSNQSANITTISGNNNAMVTGTLSNALYDYLPANSITWEERFLLGQLRPTEGVYDIIASHDSLFLAGHTGRFYMSTDNGFTWNTIGNILPSLNSSLSNAKQALILSRTIFDGNFFNTAFYYIKKDSVQNSFVNFSFVPDHFTYKLEIIGNKLWNASSRGLYSMSLSDLPGISAADDSTHDTLPVRFISFNAKCDGNSMLITWKTTQEQNSSHFTIERSADNIRWVTISNQPATGSCCIEKSYFFSDNNPLQNGYYRIAEYNKGGNVQYTDVFQSSCKAPDAFSVRPNPTHDMVFINIAGQIESHAIIKVFDSKGVLVKTQRLFVVQGSNPLSIDVRSLANGVYLISIDWNNGQTRKTVRVVKQ